jgi:hypothetical protein
MVSTEPHNVLKVHTALPNMSYQTTTCFRVSKAPKLSMYSSVPVLPEMCESGNRSSVYTGANGDSWSTYERDHCFGWFIGLVMSIQENFVLPWLLWSAK